MHLLDGRSVAARLLRKLKKQIGTLTTPPGLAFILVGNHPSSHTYVKMKKKRCAEVGIVSEVHELRETVSEAGLLNVIETLNHNSLINGILIQQPLPPHLSTAKIVEAVDPAKDVDGFHPINLGKLLASDPTGFIPCTPLGIHELLKAYKIPIEGKHVVILGRSLIVGKPLAALLMQKSPEANATVTVAHTATERLPSITKSADILVAAMGKPLFVKKSMVKPGAVVIDVGINRLGKELVGDVDAEEVAEVASHLSPVPGGVGPMTIAMLLSNTLLAVEKGAKVTG